MYIHSVVVIVVAVVWCGSDVATLGHCCCCRSRGSDVVTLAVVGALLSTLSGGGRVMAEVGRRSHSHQYLMYKSSLVTKTMQQTTKKTYICVLPLSLAVVLYVKNVLF